MNVLEFRDYYKSNTNQYPIVNILGVEEPDTYECEMSSFQKSFSVLRFHCYSRDSKNSIPGFKLEFSGVNYVDLFPKWDGINIAIASPDDCATLLSQFKYVTEPIHQDVLENKTLFSIHSRKRELKILSSELRAYQLFNKEDYRNSLH